MNVDLDRARAFLAVDDGTATRDALALVTAHRTDPVSTDAVWASLGDVLDDDDRACAAILRLAVLGAILAEEVDRQLPGNVLERIAFRLGRSPT